MIEAIINYQFMRNAATAALLASIVCGIMGIVIIEKKLVMMSGGIAHTSYGGVGLGYYLGIEPIIGAFVFAVLAALGIGSLRRRGMKNTDIIISLFWSLGMALGILFISMMKSYPPDLTSYLFGSILSVTRMDLVFISVLALLVVFTFVALYSDWKVYLFDDEFAGIMGVNIPALDNIMMVLIALTVVVLIRVVGIILVLALLTAPAASAALFTSRFKPRVLLSILFSGIFCFGGLWISYALNLASGASIVMLSVLCYLLAYLGRAVYRRVKTGGRVTAAE
ncbi:MAG: metal ABC transporter permease [Eubacteriales bacterium]|nr:metal ABC transporter permease [Eubacteriales bacterium]